MMKVIYDRRSVGQSTDGGSNFCCSSSSPSLTPSLASALAVAAESLFSKQGQTGDRASPPSCLANVTIANSAPIYDRPGDHGEHQSQWFKFTNNQLTGRVYHARSLSSLISSPSPSSPSSSSSSSLSLSLAISGTALARSNTDNSNARNCLPLANHDKNNDSSSSPTPPLSSLSSSSPSSSSPPPPSAPSTAPSLSGAATVPSLRGLPPRSCRKISAKGAPPRPHELVGVLGSPSHSSRPPLGPKTRTPTVAHIIPDRLSRGAISLTAVLIVVVQLCQVLLSTPLVSMASAQIRVSNGDLKPAVTNNLQTGSLVGGDQPNTAGLSAAMRTMPPDESWRSGPESMRDLREARPLADKLPVNMTNVFQVLFKKKPYSKYWTVEQKWDDLFKRGIAVQETMRQAMLKNFMRDIEYYADMTISPPCERDLKYIQSYTRQSTNFRWLAHMFDSTGKSEPGMLTGMLSNLGHPVQCIRVRAPGRPSNDSFDERFFEQQTRALGERFRGKYCLASLRPVLPPKPANIVVSRFSEIMNVSMLSNISYTGEPEAKIKQRARQMHVPASVYSKIDRDHLRLDQVPFESELYEYLIAQRNFVFSLPRFMGACYPSSCSREDIRMSIQRTMDDQHQVVDIEFECEQEEINPWDWFTTPRLVAYVILGLICGMVFLASLARYILLSKLQIKRSRLAPNSGLGSLLDALDMFSIDKCAGILFVKTKPASPWVDWTKVENNRSTSIDALRGFLILILVYSQLTLLGCLPVPFMWSKWSDAMFPFYRSMVTQLFINTNIWSEAFYMISAYIIALKVLENHRPKPVLLVGAGGQHFANSINNLRPSSKQAGTNLSGSQQIYQAPNLFSFAMKRYVRLVLPMAAFILFNYVWPRLSNGFVMQDQASKLMKPCDSFGWTNFILLHNHNQLNETCLWPSHVSANFFQLHLLSYPLLVLCLMALYSQFKVHYGDYDENKRRKKFIAKLLICLVYGALILLGLVGAIYPALQASGRSLIVPFLIDYLDFDNYRRVIEWMVMPTYNHLTSYMFGLGIAFVVIRRRANRELHRMQASQWGFDGALGHYNQREGSVESIRSSSTQELHQSDGLTFKQSPFGINSAGLPASIRPIDGQQIHQRQFNISSGSSGSASEKRYDDDNNDDDSLEESASSNCYLSFAKTSLCIILCLGSLLASWFWNGLGQPMSDEQTFWYVMLTKLVFCSSFAYLFHQQFATRRNSSNPWMITRFLVPIGRMSLTVFYMGWLVIWFDLLASLYQWHPSHYFVCEKYNEIIFITLIVSMFVYAAFEGIVKRLQYSSRAARLRRDIELSTTNPTLDVVGGLVGGSERSRRQMKPFESFFDPSDKPTLSELKEELKLNESTSGAGNSGSSKPADAKNQSSSLTDNTNKLNTIDAMKQQQQIAVVVHQSNYQGDTKPVYLRSTGDVSTISGGGGGGGGGGAGNLSPSDRYKLNAELRANYSFASIGLYESAGATGDLSHQQQTSDPNDKRR